MEKSSVKAHHWDDYSSLHAGVCLSGEQLNELQHTLHSMLKDIAAVCDKHLIPYFLVGGTALGAMRHSGFIPWDDDIDIAMHRQDYERFLGCFAEETAGKYYIQTPEYTDGYPSLIPRIRKSGTVVRSREDLWTDEANSGAWLDLFVIENTFDNCILRFFHGMLCLVFSGLLACRKTFAMRKSLRSFIIRGSKYERKVFIRSFIGGCFAFLPMNFLRKLANNCCRMRAGKPGKLVTIPAGHWRFFGEIYERNDFSGDKKVNFDGLPCRIPQAVEKYLAHCYGDWQTIPPEGGREKHFFCAFSLGNETPKAENGGMI